MKIKEYLDYCLNNYFLKILEENQFKIDKSDFSSIGGVYEFKSNKLKFKILNDRGLVESFVSSIFSERFYDFETLRAFFNRKNESKNGKSVFGKNGNFRKLSLKEMSEFFEKNIEFLNEQFNERKYSDTEEKLNEFEIKS
jgi:hypothetical protein